MKLEGTIIVGQNEVRTNTKLSICVDQILDGFEKLINTSSSVTNLPSNLLLVERKPKVNDF